MAKIIKNIDTVSHTYAGQAIAASGTYTIQGIEQIRFANDDALLADIAVNKARINDGTSDIAGISNQINFLKNIDMTPRDSEGATQTRVKQTASGWTFQDHCFEFKLGTHSSCFSQNPDGSNLDNLVMKFYELVNSVETLITGDNATNQTYLTANCIKTIVEWEPIWSFDVMAGEVKFFETITTDTRLYVVVVPDIPANLGGSKCLIKGRNLMYTNPKDAISIDGRSVKHLDYNATYHTNKFQFIIRHAAGSAINMLVAVQLYKA